MLPRTAPRLVSPIVRIPKHVAFATTVPSNIAKRGINTLPGYCWFGEKETPYFWSKARGMVFLAAMLMADEITFSEFFAACQELVATEGLANRFSRADHFYKTISEPWLKERPKIDEVFLGPAAVKSLTLELVKDLTGIRAHAHPPSAAVIGLRVEETEQTVSLMAENIATIPLHSMQHGISCLSWWYRTGQISYEQFGALVDVLQKISHDKLPIRTQEDQVES